MYTLHFTALPEEHTRCSAPQSLLTFDLFLLLSVSSTVANMLYSLIAQTCELFVFCKDGGQGRREGRKSGIYLIPPKELPSRPIS
jgi:hypothetical protein